MLLLVLVRSYFVCLYRMSQYERCKRCCLPSQRRRKISYTLYAFLVQSLFILCNLKPEDEQNVKYIIMLMLILIAVLFLLLLLVFPSKNIRTNIADEKWKLYDASNHQGRVHLVLLYRLTWNKSWVKHWFRFVFPFLQ